MHVQRPIKCGGQYFNYKKSFSVNLMAVVDAHYRFLYVTVGAQGSANDAAVFGESQFSEAISKPSNPLSIPTARCLPDQVSITPMMFVADEAYPLRPYLMKPFSSRGMSASERIFNYRLSRARRVVENAFGILVNRFRILRGNMQLQPDSVCDVVLACCALHNFLRHKVGERQPEHSQIFIESSATEYVGSVSHETRSVGANYNAAAKVVRDTLSKYFVGEGQVPWQWKHANITPDNDVWWTQLNSSLRISNVNRPGGYCCVSFLF